MRRVMGDCPLDPVTVEHVVKRDNILNAWKQVKANKGAPGIDGVTTEEFPEYGHLRMPALGKGFRVQRDPALREHRP